MLRFWQHQKHKYYGFYIHRSAVTSSFGKLLNKMTSKQQEPASTAPATPPPVVDKPKSKIEDGKFIAKNPMSAQPSMQSTVRDKVQGSLLRAKEKGRLHVQNLWKQNDLGTNYAKAASGRSQQGSPPNYSSGKQQQQQQQQRPPAQQQKKSNQRKTATEAVQRGRGPTQDKNKASDSNNKKTGSGGDSGGKASAAEEIEIDLDPEDAPENQPPSQGENRHLQKQIHLEHKRKEVCQSNKLHEIV
jgi:hypothetical protein